jgi:hypothetical protein
MLAVSSFFGKGSGKRAGWLTKRAPDVWDSAAFSSIFLASSFSCSQALSTPAHTQVTQTVGTPLAQQGEKPNRISGSITMNSLNDKEGSKSGNISNVVITGLFGIIIACVTGVFVLVSALINNGFIAIGPSLQSGQPTVIVVTATSQQQEPTAIIQPSVIPPTDFVQPTTALQIVPTALLYCYGSGTCWEYNASAQTMTWTGAPDGTEDIWQAAGEPLEKIRGGFTAIITTTVPGEIFACILSVDGNIIKRSCDGVLYQIPAGTHKITSASNSVGGFRWCPAVGYGYRADGSGVCK